MMIMIHEQYKPTIGNCQRTISAQQIKLLGEVLGLKICTDPLYLVLNFYQINGDGEIRTRDRLVIKALIPCQRTISTQQLKLLGKVSGYDLYYSLTEREPRKSWRQFDDQLAQTRLRARRAHIYACLARPSQAIRLKHFIIVCY